MEMSTAPRYASQSESEHHPLPLIARPKELGVHQRRHKAAPPAPRLFTPGLALTCLLAGSLSAAAVMAGALGTAGLATWPTAPPRTGAQGGGPRLDQAQREVGLTGARGAAQQNGRPAEGDAGGMQAEDGHRIQR